MFNRIQSNPVPYLLGAFLVVTTLPSLMGGRDTPFSILNNLTQKAMERGGIQMELEDGLLAQQDAARIAEARYEMGCTLVVASSDPGKFTVLTPGHPTRDPARNVPLPLGMKICDAFGNTAELIPLLDSEGNQVLGSVEFLPQPGGGTVHQIVPHPDGAPIPVAGNLAYTGNQSAIAQAIEAQQVRAVGETPQL